VRIKPRPSRAFTLLEVIIAMAIFFVAMFSVMQLMSRGLGMARSLQQDMPSPGMIAAELAQMAATNRIDDGGSYSGDFEFLAPEIYPDFKWAAQTYQYASNGLFKADIVVVGERNGQPVERAMSVFLFSPRSATPGGMPGMNTPPPGR
jgi:prepilin-type N-terminal cleavage/methylation domain-containing protein